MQLNSDVEESNRQFREAWSLYARASRGGEVFDRDGLTVMNANHPWFFLNVGILNAPVVDEPDLVRRAQAALTYFGGRANPWILTGSEDWFGPGAKAVLSRLGIAHKLDLMGMVAEKLHPPIRPLPDVEVQAISDEETRVALADLNADCYGVPLEWGRQAIAGATLWQGRLFGTLAYMDGAPAAGAFATPLEDALYVGWVATAKGHRGRGLVELVMRTSLEAAHRATGLDRTVLHATEAGFPVYVRMGYRAVVGFPVYGPR